MAERVYRKKSVEGVQSPTAFGGAPFTQGGHAADAAIGASWAPPSTISVQGTAQSGQRVYRKKATATAPQTAQRTFRIRPEVKEYQQAYAAARPYMELQESNYQEVFSADGFTITGIQNPVSDRIGGDWDEERFVSGMQKLSPPNDVGAHGINLTIPENQEGMNRLRGTFQTVIDTFKDGSNPYMQQLTTNGVALSEGTKPYAAALAAGALMRKYVVQTGSAGQALIGEVLAQNFSGEELEMALSAAGLVKKEMVRNGFATTEGNGETFTTYEADLSLEPALMRQGTAHYAALQEAERKKNEKNANIHAFGSSFMTGLAQFGDMVHSGADWLIPDDQIAKWFGVENKMGDWFDDTRVNMEGVYRWRDNLSRDADPTVKTIAYNVVTPVAAALPNLVLSFAAPATSATGAAGFIPKAVQSVKNLVNNPNFWLSFVQVGGSAYQSAIDSGATETEAQAVAWLSAIPNAALEANFGIENAPDGGGIRAFVKNLVDEGKEEVLQGIIEQAVRTVVFEQENEWRSWTDPDAVFSGERALQEFIGGVTVAGVLGAPGAVYSGADYAYQSYQCAKLGSQFINGKNGVTIDDAIRIGLSNAKGTDAYNAAVKLQQKVQAGKTVSPYAVGRMVAESQTEQARTARNIERTVLDTAKEMNIPTDAAETVSAAAVSLGQKVEFVSPEGMHNRYMAGEYDRATDTVRLNAAERNVDKLIGAVLAHEMVHTAEGTDQLQKLAQIAQRMENHKNGAGAWEKLQADVKSKYAAADKQLSDPEVKKEALAHWIAENLFQNKAFAKAVADGDANVGNAFFYMIDRVRRAMGAKKASAGNLAMLERLFMQALDNRTHGGGEGVQYSLGYNNAIDQLAAGKLDRTQNSHLKLLDHTPQLYIEKAGAKDLKIIARWDTAYLAMRKDGDIPGNYHGLGPDVMKAIPKALQDPLYIVKQNNGRIVAITEIAVKGKRPVIVSIELDAFQATTQDGSNEAQNYNLIVTFTDAKANYLQNTIFSGDVVYQKNNEDPAHFILRLKSLKKALPNDDLAASSDTTVAQNAPDVNTQSMQEGAGISAQGALLSPESMEAVRNGTWREARVEGDGVTPSADGATSSTASGPPSPEGEGLQAVEVDEAAVLETALRSQLQGKRIVEVDTSARGVEDVAPYIETLEAQLGEPELLKRMYNATRMDRPTGMVEIDGKRVDANAYMDAYEQSLPKDKAALERHIEHLREQRAAEVAKLDQEGALEDYHFGGLKIDLQLFAATRMWDLLQLEVGEAGTEVRQFYEKRLRGTDAIHNQELIDLLSGQSETYNPIGNQKTLDKAKRRLESDKKKARLLERIGKYDPWDKFDAVEVAAGIELIRRAVNDGEIGVAADLIRGLSRKGTEAGRAVQAFSMMARLTPEGALKAAIRTVQADADYAICEGANEGLDVLADDIARAIKEAQGKGISSDEIADRIRNGEGVRGVEDADPYETEEVRYQRLKDRTINVVQDRSREMPTLPLDELEHKVKSKAEKVIYKLAKEIGVLNRELSTPDLDITFELTKGNGLKASLSHQLQYGGNYADFARALINLDAILENAVLIEQHTDKYAGTNREKSNLINASVLVGAFQDGSNLIPVQFVIKQMADSPNKLYLTVALTKVETGVMGATTTAEMQKPRNLLPISKYSLAQLFANVNPQDAGLLKYIPDGFLSETQRTAKKAAQEQERARIEGYRKKAPSREELTQLLSEDLAAEKGNFFTQEEISDLLWKTVEDCTNIPEQLKRYVLKKIRKDDGALAQRIYELHQRGDLKQVKLRRAMEEALELPHLTDEDLSWIAKQGAKIEGLQDKPVEQAEAMEEMYDFLGAKLTVTGWDRLQAWRKFGMLANVKTHLRNIFSNAAYAGIRKADDAVAMVLERLLVRDKSQRSAALGWSHTEHGKNLLPTLQKQAELAVLEMQKRGAKYEQGTGQLKQKRKFFGESKVGEVLNKGNRWNSDMLEAEDVWFFRPAYIDALGQLMTARQVTEITPELHDIAMQRALEATFRADNAISEVISSLKRFQNATTTGKRLFGHGVDVVIPFHKTPANIANQTIMHSPVGIVKGAFDLYNATIGKGSKDAATAINTMAKGVTGTALLAIGLLLGRAGLFNVGFGKTEKERAADEAAGLQDGSFVIGGVSVSLDWLQPAASPLIVGASLGERMNEEGLTLGGVFGAVMDGTDSLFELTMLQSLYDILGGYDAGASATAMSVAENVVSQSVPTLVGQVARAIDPVQRKTTGDTDFETLINQVMAKIPGLTYLLDPELDMWGNEVYRTGKPGTGTAVLNALQQLVIPANTKVGTGKDDPLTQEILRLYTALDTSVVIPSEITRDEAAEIGEERVNLNRLLGGVNRLAVEEFINNQKPYDVMVNTGELTEKGNPKQKKETKYYRDMTDEERRKVLARIYSGNKDAIIGDASEKTEEQLTDSERYFRDLIRRVKGGERGTYGGGGSSVETAQETPPTQQTSTSYFDDLLRRMRNNGN